MTTAQTPAQQNVLDVALGYFNAWTKRNIEEAMTFVADDVVFDQPFGRAEGAGELRASLENFMEIYKGAEIVDAFADDHSAAIIYLTETIPAKTVPACEYLGIENGRISYKRLIFDRSPFMAGPDAA
jgi:hypothetical protein